MASKLFRQASARIQQVRQHSVLFDAAEHAHHVKTTRMWKILSLTVVPVAVSLTYYNAFYLMPHHHRPEYVEYDHLRIRTKAFPWGDGNHTLFHNPQMNAIPGVGYEEDEEHH